MIPTLHRRNLSGNASLQGDDMNEATVFPTSAEPESFDFRFNKAPNERLFSELRDAYAAWGGIVSSEDLAALLGDSHPGLSRPGLARLIAEKEIFCFEWQGADWVPMVHFHVVDMTINGSIGLIRRELGENQDGWEAACWFVCPNGSLSGRRPLDLVDQDLDAVVQAARASRFLPGS